MPRIGTRATPPAAQGDSAGLTIEGDLALDDAPDRPADGDLLRQLAAHTGSRLYTPDDLQYLLNINPVTIRAAKADRLLVESVAGPRQGYTITDVAGWIRRNHVAFIFSPTAEAMLTATPVEAIDAESDHDSAAIERKFGIGQHLVRDAIRDDELHGVGSQPARIFAERVPGDALIDWIDRCNVRYCVFVQLARQIADRRAASAAAENEPPVEPVDTGIVGEAFDELDEAARENEAIENESRRKAWASYRAILGRIESPEPGDKTALAEVCKYLQVEREQVQSDISTLAKVAELRVEHSKQDERAKEVIASNKELKKLHRDQEDQFLAVKKRVSQAWYFSGLSRDAPREIAELQQQNPNLFD